ncbi:hypothetical protein FBUS_10363 [Fasciolopsis buskii]|uniref:Uncharacterized protein n=1 Tax=Fasciolopsis buskii TaxID=27845 RepID=A0A8E0VL90_9TREM|nr:hypothetical protein FBUS_10363 [Fasciolopsis buski]
MPRKQFLACVRKSTDSIVSDNTNNFRLPSVGALDCVKPAIKTIWKTEKAKNVKFTKCTSGAYFEEDPPPQMLARMKDFGFSFGVRDRNKSIISGVSEPDIGQSGVKRVENWIQSTGSNQPAKLDRLLMDTEAIRKEYDSHTTVSSTNQSSPIVYNDQLYEIEHSSEGGRSWESEYSRIDRSYSDCSVGMGTERPKMKTDCIPDEPRIPKVKGEGQCKMCTLFMEQCQMETKFEPDRVELISPKPEAQDEQPDSTIKVQSRTYKSTLTISISAVPVNSVSRSKITDRSRTNEEQPTVWKTHSSNLGFNPRGCAPHHHQTMDENNEQYISTQHYLHHRNLSNNTEAAKDCSSRSMDPGTDLYDDDHFTSVSEIGATRRLDPYLELIGYNLESTKSKPQRKTLTGDVSYSPKSSLTNSCSERQSQTNSLKIPVIINNGNNQNFHRVSPLTKENLEMHNLNYQLK